MPTSRRHLTVRGRVHGVGFRWSCRNQAQRLGVAGWVRNLPDGTVEVVVEGETDAVEQLVAWCREGPRLARVTDLDVRSEPVGGETGFVIAY